MVLKPSLLPVDQWTKACFPAARSGSDHMPLLLSLYKQAQGVLEVGATGL